jgi:hypothetical protein
MRSYSLPLPLITFSLPLIPFSLPLIPFPFPIPLVPLPSHVLAALLGPHPHRDNPSRANA